MLFGSTPWTTQTRSPSPSRHSTELAFLFLSTTISCACYLPACTVSLDTASRIGKIGTPPTVRRVGLAPSAEASLLRRRCAAVAASPRLRQESSRNDGQRPEVSNVRRELAGGRGRVRLLSQLTGLGW